MTSIIDAIGDTPLLHLPSLSTHYGLNLYGKAEFLNPAGSVKDRAALNLIQGFEGIGELIRGSGQTVIEGTGGNTGVGLAFVCSIFGYKAIFTMPDNVSVEKIRAMENHGASVILCDSSLGVGDESHYTSVARKLNKDIEGSVHTNQFLNLGNMEAHEKNTGPEILHEFLRVKANAKCIDNNLPFDAFSCAAGTGGTISGISKYLKSQYPSIHTCLSDVPGSGLKSYLATGKFGKTKNHETSTKAEGVGISRLVGNFAAGRGYIDGGINVSDVEGVKMAMYLAYKEGIFVGPSAAMNVVGAVKVGLRLKREWKEKNLDSGEEYVPKVVTILCDSGSSYNSKLYNQEWREANGLGIEVGDIQKDPAGYLKGLLDDSEGGYVARGEACLFVGHEGGS